MPSTYTTNNGLEKIGTGEQSGTWGDTTNLNFDILDQALDGLVTVTATDTGSSGSPNTLPITDGSLSDGRNRLIIITDGGDLGGSVYYQLTPADAEKIVFLRNSLSGSQDLILFQGTYNAARDLIVPAGKDVIVKFSGTGTSTAVVAPVFADLSLDAATIASADINGGTIDGVTIGVTSVATVINVDNLKLDGNTLSSTDTNGNVVLAPNGDGDVQLDADTVRVGDNNNDVTITTNGTGDLTLNTNSGTDSGSIEIQDGANTNIIITADGTGKLELANGDITTSAASGSDAAGQDLTIQAGASTGNAAGGDMVFQTTPAGAGSGTNLNSYTTVLTLTDDSKMQIGTSTAVNSILDEDDMNSDSATALATQQSIKKYVDDQVATADTWSEVLANGNTSGATDAVITAGQKITTDTIDETTADAGVTIDSVLLKDDVVNATDIETSTISANDGTTAINIADSTGAVDIDTSLNVDGTITGDGLTVDGSASFTNTFFIERNNPNIRFDDNDTSNNGEITLDNTALRIEVDEDNAVAGSLIKFQVDGSIKAAIEDSGDITFYDTSGNASFVYDESDGTTINDNQDAKDFTVKSDNNASMLYVDGASDLVGIGHSSPSAILDVKSTTAVVSTLRGTTSSIAYLDITNYATSAVGVGSGIEFRANSSVQERQVGFITADWTDNTDATRDSRMDFHINMNGGTTRMLKLGVSDVIVNGGNHDTNFQVNSVNQDNMLFVDAAEDRVGVGTGSPAVTLEVLDPVSNNFNGAIHVGGAGSNRRLVLEQADVTTYHIGGTGTNSVTKFVSGGTAGVGSVRTTIDQDGNLQHNKGAIFNDTGGDNNFQVKALNTTYMLFVDASTDRVGVGTNSPGALLDVKSGTVPVARLTNGEDKSWSVGNEIGVFEFYTTDASSPNGTKVAAEISSENSISSSVPSGELVFKTSQGGSSSTNAVEQARITSEGTLSLNGGNVGLKSDSTDTSSTAQATIFSFSTGNTGAKFVVSVDDTTDTERYITELLVTHDGTTAVATEYGQVATDTALATFDVDISGGSVRLLATPASSNSMTFKVMSTTLA